MLSSSQIWQQIFLPVYSTASIQKISDAGNNFQFQGGHSGI